MGSDWAEPGYFAKGSRLRSAFRLLWQLFKPPRGHRTLPVKAGWILILLALGVGSAAFNTGNNILYLGLALLLGSLLLSGVLSWLNFKGCRWRLTGPERARVGATYSLGIELANDKKFLPTTALRFRVTEGATLRPEAVYLDKALSPGKSTVLHWSWQPQQRGKVAIVLRGIVSEYPFGFLRKTIVDSLVLPVVVWPSYTPYTSQRAQSAQGYMGRERPRSGNSGELQKLRAYITGDPPGAIHWKASARTGTWVVKELGEKRKAYWDVLIEPCTWLAAGEPVCNATFEAGICFIASVLEDCFQLDELRSVFLHDHWHPINGSVTHWMHLMDTLATLEHAATLEAARQTTRSNRPPTAALRFICTADKTWQCQTSTGTIRATAAAQ